MGEKWGGSREVVFSILAYWRGARVWSWWRGYLGLGVGEIG